MESILENNQYRLYWDRCGFTNQPEAHSRTDLILMNKVTSKHNEEIMK